MSRRTRSESDRPRLQRPVDYEVGYARPPEATRFEKGRSGNPKGRPKGAKSRSAGPLEERLKAILLEEAYREITVRDGERQVTVPMAQAIVRAMAVNAAKGQHRAQRLFAEMLSSVERQERQLQAEWLDTAMTYKIEWERELDRRHRLGITDLPDPLPHPDHILINMRTGTARVAGPATKEEKAEYDMWLARKADFLAELDELEDDLDGETDPQLRAVIETEIGRTEKVLEIIRRAIPD